MVARLEQLSTEKEKAAANFQIREYFRLTQAIWEQRHSTDAEVPAIRRDGAGP